VPVRALSKMFRGRFCTLVHQERPDLNLPESVWTTDWVVYCKPTVQGTERVLDYLGRYVHRIALTNSRILSIDDGRVCFRYADSRTHRWKTMTLPAPEFLRRFLPHVLPQGFHKARYDGRWSPANRALLRRVQLGLAGPTLNPPADAPEPASRPDDLWCLPPRPGQTCPHCGQGLLVLVRLLPRLRRGPP
jgi:putative transposase